MSERKRMTAERVADLTPPSNSWVKDRLEWMRLARLLWDELVEERARYEAAIAGRAGVPPIPESAADALRSIKSLCEDFLSRGGNE